MDFFTITLTIIASRIRAKSAARGARKIAIIDSIRLAIFSPVDTTGLPIPAVMAVDTPLVTTVAPCTAAVTPPPAIIARAH